MCKKRPLDGRFLPDRWFRQNAICSELNVKIQVNPYIPFRRLLAKTDVLIREDRLHKKSVIVVSQFSIGTWDRVFRDKTTADAVKDRLVHLDYPLGLLKTTGSIR